jgi:hypothetical protein
MKLLMENWRQYLVESDRKDQMKKEFIQSLQPLTAELDQIDLPTRPKNDPLDPNITLWDRFREEVKHIFRIGKLAPWYYDRYKPSPEQEEWDKKFEEIATPLHSTASRLYKQIYNKYVDREFLNNLTFVHWDLNPTLYINADKKHQTSAEGYLPGHELEQHWGRAGIGIRIKGHVVIGSNYSFGSGGGYEAQPGKESSGYVKSIRTGFEFQSKHKIASGYDLSVPESAVRDFDNLVVDEDSFKNKSRWDKSLTEFILDNWEPLAIVVVGGRKNRHFDEALQAAQENNLPMIDENQNPIEVENPNETPP